MALRAPREREPRVDILEGDDVPPAAVHKPLNGIECRQMAGVRGDKILRFSQYLLTIHIPHLPEVRYLPWKHAQAPEVVDEVADGAWLGTDETLRQTERQEQWIELLSSKVGVCLTEALYLRNDLGRPEALAFCAWSSGPLIERFQLPAAILPLMLPPIQSRPFDRERVQRSGKAVLLPEHQYLRPLEGSCANHIPVA